MSGDGLRVFPVTYSQTKPFLLSVHYARRMPNIRYAFGLFDGWDLIGVCTFGSPASPPLCKGLAGEENHKHVLELNRLAFLPGKNGMNHASILVGRSLRMLPHGTFVVSFADWGGWHHVGYVYQATNWLYTGLTKARTDLAGVGGGHFRHYAEGETRRVQRTAKHRYVFLMGSKRERKRMRKELRYEVLPYPKGESVRYDTADPKGFVDTKQII